ncbi:MAG: DUF1566 domain-containing protein [Myxococcota bacterium]
MQCSTSWLILLAACVACSAAESDSTSTAPAPTGLTASVSTTVGDDDDGSTGARTPDDPGSTPGTGSMGTGETTAADSDPGDDSGSDETSAGMDCVPGDGWEAVGSAAFVDNTTCLMWTNEVQAMGSSWVDIAAHCDALSLEGYDDWRMPTTAEALSLPVDAFNDPYWGAALTSPRFVAPGTAPEQVDGTFHICAVAWFNSVDATCQWWGPANTNGTFCVRGGGGPLPPMPDACATACANAEGWDPVAE